MEKRNSGGGGILLVSKEDAASATVFSQNLHEQERPEKAASTGIDSRGRGVTVGETSAL